MEFLHLKYVAFDQLHFLNFPETMSVVVKSCCGASFCQYRHTHIDYRLVSHRPPMLLCCRYLLWSVSFLVFISVLFHYLSTSSNLLDSSSPGMGLPATLNIPSNSLPSLPTFRLDTATECSNSLQNSYATFRTISKLTDRSTTINLHSSLSNLQAYPFDVYVLCGAPRRLSRFIFPE